MAFNLHIIMDTTYVSVKDRLAVYRALDTILNSNEDVVTKATMFIAGLDTQEKRMIATEYYDRNKVAKPIDLGPLVKYKDPFEEEENPFHVWQDTEDQLSYDDLPADYWQKLYASHPVKKEEDCDTWSGSLFPDHDSDEYQDRLEFLWDREDRAAEKLREQGL